MSSFPTENVAARPRRWPWFQSAVAHELISNDAQRDNRPRIRNSFKALSRMSSFPTELSSFRWGGKDGFKALSRMSSFPTRPDRLLGGLDQKFQSAVAHELISNQRVIASIAWQRAVSKRCRA